MRTTVGVIIGAVLAWCWIAIWRGPTRWLFTRIEVPTHRDCHTRIRVWIGGDEQAGATWPE